MLKKPMYIIFLFEKNISDLRQSTNQVSSVNEDLIYFCISKMFLKKFNFFDDFILIFLIF